MKILKYIGMALLGIVLCANFAACSDDENYETAVKTIHVETAGTLSTLISADAIEQITDLTLSGYINGTDVKIIRKMPLKRADFTDLHIVGGGDYYEYSDIYNQYYTEDNIFPAYFGGYWLSEIKLPNSVTEIGDGAFSNCLNLASVEIPNSITKIGENSFGNCECLKTIKIPDSVTEIEYWAFNGCTSLVSIEIPNSVTEIGREAFSNCSNLTSVKISNNVTALYGTFNGCTSLASVEIPNSVTTLDQTFNGCTSLVSIEIPNSVTTLDGTFSGCTSLASIKIPDSVTKIEYYTFSGCTSLTSVEIPNSITDIGYQAFADAGLKEIHMKNPTPPDVEDNAFSTYAYVTLYVPVGSKDTYMQHKIWGKFGNIVEE